MPLVFHVPCAAWESQKISICQDPSMSVGQADQALSRRRRIQNACARVVPDGHKCTTCEEHI